MTIWAGASYYWIAIVDRLLAFVAGLGNVLVRVWTDWGCPLRSECASCAGAIFEAKFVVIMAVAAFVVHVRLDERLETSLTTTR